MKQQYCVYLHYKDTATDPFYIGASSNLERPYNFQARGRNWVKIYDSCNGNIRVEIIKVETKEDCNILEKQLIEKHKSTICNISKGSSLPKQELISTTSLDELAKLGLNIRLCRLRRLLSQKELSKLCKISSPTLKAIESGSPTVGLIPYLNVLHILNIDQDLGVIGQNDVVGKLIERQNLLMGKTTVTRF